MLDTPTQGRITLDLKPFFTKNVVYRELLSTLRNHPQPVVRLDAPNDEQLRQAEQVVDRAYENQDDNIEQEGLNVQDFEQQVDQQLADLEV